MKTFFVVVGGGFDYIVETISKTISYKQIDKQKFTIFFLHFFTISHSFPMGVIFDQRPQVWLFFLRPLSMLRSWPQFFCVFKYIMP